MGVLHGILAKTQLRKPSPELKRRKMKSTNALSLFFCGLIAHSQSIPQGYSGETQNLNADTLHTIGDIFGNSEGQNSKIVNNHVTEQPSENQFLKENLNSGVNEYQPPDDYVQPNSNEPLIDKAVTEVNTQFENCADYTESQGYECVPYYQCHNGTIITDGSGLIDIRNGFGVLTPEDTKCPGFLDVCCKDPDFVPPPPPKIKYSPKCGRRNQNGLGVRIQGFTESESQFGEWPHMCAILHEKPIEQEAGYGSTEPQTANLYQCGGSLIAPGTILTAAHCVEKFRQNPTHLKIRCGEWDTQNETEPYPHQDRYVEALNIHPEFDGRNLHNDFAVLFTSEDFVLASHIDTVCLPQADELFEESTCFATGWGKDKFGSAGQYQVVLKEIDLPVLSNYECQDRLQSTRLGKKFNLHDSFICAGGVNGMDTCKGDGGSPLVCPSKYDPDTYVQAGMVSWGIGCGEDGTPGVYASVSKALCWIDYAMSCHYGANTGDYSSFNGYTSNVCQTWMDRKISDLERKRNGAGKYGRIFEGQIQGFTQCTVNWKEPQAPLVDVSNYGRSTEKEYSEPQKSLTEINSGVKTDPAYTEDSADLSEVVKAPEPVY